MGRLKQMETGSMNQATHFQFERTVQEYAAWRAVNEDERSPAAAWWWGPALELLDEQHPMPPEFCAALELADGASYAQAAEKLIDAIAPQVFLPWPNNFPRQPKHVPIASQDSPGAS
jgi:hypothetical protein